MASIRMSWPRYAEVFGLALLNWIGDCAALACAIRAAGQPVPWDGLLIAYAAGAAAGSTGLTPGGFGLVEATLTAALVAVGMNSAGGADLGARLPASQLLDDPDRRLDHDDHADPVQEPYRHESR